VGGIEEIHNLQSALVEMAARLAAARQSLHSYIGAMTAGIENERRSLARELHDETIQSLIALNQRIQLAGMHTGEDQNPLLKELQSLVQQTMTDLRRLIRGLRPIYLEDLGLSTSLEMLVSETGQAAGIPISFQSRGTERRLDAQIEMSLYRMVQESLNNVVRHAKAAHAWVELTFDTAGLILQVRDDGTGFSFPKSTYELAARAHFGLLGLQERAEIIRASLHIDSIPGQGTSIVIHVPLPPL
jgi:signal transduction histidine kinase